MCAANQELQLVVLNAHVGQHDRMKKTNSLERYKMKKTILMSLFLTLLVSNQSFAGELFLVSGSSQSPRHRYVQAKDRVLAKEAALAKLPKEMKQHSDWIFKEYSFCFYQACTFFTIAHASFEDLLQAPPWTLVTDANSAESHQDAQEMAKRKAKLFCSSEVEEAVTWKLEEDDSKFQRWFAEGIFTCKE